MDKTERNHRKHKWVFCLGGRIMNVISFQLLESFLRQWPRLPRRGGLVTPLGTSVPTADPEPHGMPHLGLSTWLTTPGGRPQAC